MASLVEIDRVISLQGGRVLKGVAGNNFCDKWKMEVPVFVTSFPCDHFRLHYSYLTRKNLETTSHK